MKGFSDNEYHPIIEEYITEYVEETIDPIERDAFEEVLVHDDDLRELAFSAKEGMKLIKKLVFITASDTQKSDFIARIKKSC